MFRLSRSSGALPSLEACCLLECRRRAIIGTLSTTKHQQTTTTTPTKNIYTTTLTTPHQNKTMPDSSPPPRSWCLRFKLNRTTILLHIDALQTLASVRAELLGALQATHPDNIFKGTTRENTPIAYPLPASAEDIALAKPTDPYDPNSGWEAIGDDLEDGLIFDEDVVSTGKGKGKASAASSSTRGASSSRKSDVNDCPQGAGLKDGSVVAFRFRLPEEKARRQRLIEGSLDVDEIARDGMGDDADWDVVVPSMEETYGEEDAAAAEMG